MSDTSDRFSALFTSGAILFAGTIFDLGSRFVVRVIVARFFGRVDYGAVALGTTLLTTASVLALIGTHNGVGRFLPRYDDPEHRRGVLVSAFTTALPIATLLGVGVVLAADPIARYAFTDPSVAPIVRIFGFAIPLATLLRLTIGTVRGRQEALPRVYIQNGAVPLSRFLFIAIAVGAGFGVAGVAWGYVASYLLVAGVCVWYLVARTDLFEPVQHVGMHRELLSFSAPLMVIAAMNLLFQNIDTFLVGFFSTTGDVGVYNVAYPLASLLTLVLTSFSFIFMPVISELHSDGRQDELRRTFQVVTKWILIATLPIFLVLVSYPGVVIRTTFGPEYVDGGFTLAVLAVGFFSHAVAGPAGNAMTALGRTRVIMYDGIAVAAVNIALNIVLIPRYGILGAAAATTVGYLLMNGLYLAQLNRATDVHPFRATMLRPALISVAIWAGLYALGQSLGPSLPVVVASGVAFVCIYGVAILRYGGVDPEERELVDQFERRVGVDLTSVRRIAAHIAG